MVHTRLCILMLFWFTSDLDIRIRHPKFELTGVLDPKNLDHGGIFMSLSNQGPYLYMLGPGVLGWIPVYSVLLN